jgi:DNA polymerase-3 subunit delta
VAELKTAYLIHGDDHGAIAERRAGLRALADRLDGAGAGVELLEGDSASPAGVAAALTAMTLALGRRVIVVDGVERWREADVREHLAPAMDPMPENTTLALFAREEARTKAPDAVHEAVARAGGQVWAQMTVKPWELPRWVRAQAARLALSLDGEAAKLLVAQVGERQQRLLRELEKLALESVAVAPAPDAPADATAGTVSVSAAQIELRAARSAERRGYVLADALLAGDRGEALRTYLRLREQGERPAGLVYVIAQRLREALALALRLRAGEPRAELKRGLRIPSGAADRLLAEAERSDPERLRNALAVLADLELDSRGGAPIRSRRTSLAGMSEDTLVVRAIEAIAREVGATPAGRAA